MQAFLEAVKFADGTIHARYPGAKRTLCGQDVGDDAKVIGTASGQTDCEDCKKAWQHAVREGEFTAEQMEQPEK